jgi:hypothetical protein
MFVKVNFQLQIGKHQKRPSLPRRRQHSAKQMENTTKHEQGNSSGAKHLLFVALS